MNRNLILFFLLMSSAPSHWIMPLDTEGKIVLSHFARILQSFFGVVLSEKKDKVHHLCDMGHTLINGAHEFIAHVNREKQGKRNQLIDDDMNLFFDRLCDLFNFNAAQRKKIRCALFLALIKAENEIKQSLQEA